MRTLTTTELRGVSGASGASSSSVPDVLPGIGRIPGSPYPVLPGTTYMLLGNNLLTLRTSVDVGLANTTQIVKRSTAF